MNNPKCPDCSHDLYKCVNYENETTGWACEYCDVYHKIDKLPDNWDRSITGSEGKKLCPECAVYFNEISEDHFRCPNCVYEEQSFTYPESSELSKLERVALEIYKEKLRLDKPILGKSEFCFELSNAVRDAKSLIDMCSPDYEVRQDENKRASANVEEKLKVLKAMGVMK